MGPYLGAGGPEGLKQPEHLMCSLPDVGKVKLGGPSRRAAAAAPDLRGDQRDDARGGMARRVLGSLTLMRALSLCASFRPGPFLRSHALAGPPSGGAARSHPHACFASVTGSVYESGSAADPVVTLYTKEGCTLCDKAKDVLKALSAEHPHSLEAVDITDEDKEEWFDRYKYDIPVLHMDGVYWAKHRLSDAEARDALTLARERKDAGAPFPESKGQPDASRLERK